MTRQIKYPLLLLLICVAALACNKSSDEPTSTAAFTVTGVQDVNLTTNSTASQSLLLTVTSASPESVSLYADGLPKGVYASFAPSSGTTPFTTRVTFWNDFSGSGGTFPVTIVGNGPSGTRQYKMNVTLDHFKGWKFGDSVYQQKGLLKDAGSSSRYPNIKVYGGGAGLLTISFGLGKSLPRANKTYPITPFSGTADAIQITMSDDPEIYSATGGGNPTATFHFDSLGRFVFKCNGVEMSNGVQKKLLDCNIIE